MRITGIQKLTLLDFPGRIAATLFTPGCDLRCPFCHNSVLVKDASELEYDPQEVLDFLAGRVGRLQGVCITGGEPLMQENLADYIRKLRALELAVKLDTNGTYPDRLKAIYDEGLVDYVAMDLKNGPTSWAKTAGMSGKAAEELYKKTLESMELIKNSGVPYEFRTTVVREYHRPEDMEELGRLAEGAPAYYLQCFTDSGDILTEGCSAWDKATMEAYLKIVQKYVPCAQLRGVE